MKIEIATDVAAPPATVFAVVTDIAHWTQFVRAIEALDILTDGPVRAGTRFRETRTMFGRRATEEMTIAAIEAPHRFDLTAENHGTRYLASHRIEAMPPGSRLTLTFEGTPMTFAAKLFTVIGTLFLGPMRRQLQSDLDDLRAEAERRARS